MNATEAIASIDDRNARAHKFFENLGQEMWYGFNFRVKLLEMTREDPEFFARLEGLIEDLRFSRSGYVNDSRKKEQTDFAETMSNR